MHPGLEITSAPRVLSNQLGQQLLSPVPRANHISGCMHIITVMWLPQTFFEAKADGS
jgi:hypothetical protein